MAEEKLTIGDEDILYVSSVPVTLYHSGATFMYRLFEGFEKRLIIFQGIRLKEDEQLKNIDYHYYEPALKRVRFTRFKEFFEVANIIRNFFFVPSKLKQLILNKKPKVVVTVSNGLLWILAYRVAKKYKLPLVVLVHDDMNCYYSPNTISGKLIHYLFKKVFKYARLRFCISKLMSEDYQARYNVFSEVLYPLQGKQAMLTNMPEKASKRINIAYAGSLDVGSYADMILLLAKELKKVEGSVIVFANSFTDQLAAQDNIINYGFLHPEELQKKLEANADAFFVPFPFYEKGLNVELAFPSKVADYTLIPKPLLIMAPHNCALSGWFRSLSAPVGVLVESLDNDAVGKAITAIADSSNNAAWGNNSFNTGKEFFGNEKQQSFFFGKLKDLTG